MARAEVHFDFSNLVTECICTNQFVWGKNQQKFATCLSVKLRYKLLMQWKRSEECAPFCMKLLNKFIKSVFAHIWNGHDWSQYITSVQQFAIGERKKSTAGEKLKRWNTHERTINFLPQHELLNIPICKQAFDKLMENDISYREQKPIEWHRW